MVVYIIIGGVESYWGIPHFEVQIDLLLKTTLDNIIYRSPL